MLLLTIFASLLFSGCHPGNAKNATMRKAEKLFNKAGGIEKVSQEAKIMLTRFGAEDYKVLTNWELKDFPAISALGNMVAVRGSKSGYPAQIRIRYGNHFRTKFILIYAQQTPADPNETAAFLLVTNNIFIPAE
jgi:hypothetical protein